MSSGRKRIYNTEEEKEEQMKRRKEYKLKILIKPFKKKDIKLPAYINQQVKEDERFKKVQTVIEELFNEDKILFEHKNNLKQNIKDYSKKINKIEYKQEIQTIRKQKLKLKEKYNLLIEKEKQVRADNKNSYNLDKLKENIQYNKEQYKKVLDRIWTLHKVDYEEERKKRQQVIKVIKQEQVAKRKKEREKNKNNDNEDYDEGKIC